MKTSGTGGMRKYNRFEAGSGCYTCRICKRKTRKTGDGAGCELCELCYEASGIENTMSDNGETPELFAEWTRLLNEVEKRGGTPDRRMWWRTADVAEPVAPAVEPAPVEAASKVAQAVAEQIEMVEAGIAIEKKRWALECEAIAGRVAGGQFDAHLGFNLGRNAAELVAIAARIEALEGALRMLRSAK